MASEQPLYVKVGIEKTESHKITTTLHKNHNVSTREKRVQFAAPDEGILMFPNSNDPHAGVSMFMDIMKGNASQGETGKKCLHPDRVFLNSCSTFIQMVIHALLTDVHENDPYLFGFYNAGTTAANSRKSLEISRVG